MTPRICTKTIQTITARYTENYGTAILGIMTHHTVKLSTSDTENLYVHFAIWEVHTNNTLSILKCAQKLCGEIVHKLY